MKNRILAFSVVIVLAMGVFVGCAKKETAPEQNTAVNVEGGKVTNFHDAIAEAYGEDYLPSMQLDKTGLAEKFGVTTDNVKDFVAEVPMIGTYVDTLVIIEAEDGKADAVETELNAYREALLADTMQYPMNIAKINSSKVYKVDEYVFFIMLGAIDETNEDEKAQLEFAQKETQKAIDAINKIVEK